MATPGASKYKKIAQALGESVYSRSPVIGGALEVAQLFKKPDTTLDPSSSRLKNVGRFAVDTAVQNSVVLRKAANVFDFIMSLREGEPSHLRSSITTSTTNIQANGTSAARIKVTLRDNQSNQIQSGGDQVHMVTSEGVLSPVVDMGDGTYTANLTSNVAGAATVSAHLGTNTLAPRIGSVSIQIVGTGGPGSGGGPGGSGPGPGGGSGSSGGPGNTSSQITDNVTELADKIQEIVESSPSKVVEYLEDKDNKYSKSLDQANARLERIIEILQEQVDIMKMTADINEEMNERSLEAKRLGTVGRTPSDTLRSSLLPGEPPVRPDMAQMDDPRQQEDGGGGVLGGIMNFLGENWELIAGGSALALGKTRLGRMASTVFSKLPGKAAIGRFMTKMPGAGAATGLLSKAAPWLGRAGGVASKFLGPLSMGLIGKDIYDFGKQAVDKSEALRERYPDLRGLNLGLAQEQYLVESPDNDGDGIPDMLADAVKEAKRNGTFDRNMRELDARARATVNGKGWVTENPTPGPLLPQTEKFMGDEPGSMMTPQNGTDEIMKYLDSLQSPSAMRTQSNLDVVGKAAMPQVPVETTKSAPVIVNKQGGPTNINNGGNVTNIIMGGSSLTLPQLAYNLPSALN